MRRRRLVGSVSHLFHLPAIGLAVGVVGLLGYRQVSRVVRSTRPVLVAQTALAAGTVVAADQVGVVRKKQDEVPANALSSPEQAQGRKLARPKQAGDALVGDDFGTAVAKKGASLSSQIPEGRVLTTVTIHNLTVPHQGLVRGDRIDILVSGLTLSRQRAARVVVRDAFVVGYVTPTQPKAPEATPGPFGLDLGSLNLDKKDKPSTALLLALPPDDVIKLAEIDGAGAHITVVLHSVDEATRGEPLMVAGKPYPKTVDVIVGDSRERVIVR